MTLNELILLIVIYVLTAVLFWYLGASNQRKKCKMCKPKVDLSGLKDARE